MATFNNKPASVGLSDPRLVRQTETALAQAAIIARGKPTVTSAGELILPSTTLSVGTTAVSTTTSANNSSADIVTVYSGQGAIYASSIDQTVNQTIVNQVGVSSIVAGNNVTITSTGTSVGTGIVTINATGGNGGNGTPGGSNTQIQFNDANAFGGNAGFTFNKTTGVLAAPLADVSGVANTVGSGATVAAKSVLSVASTFGSNSSADPASAQAIRGRVTGSNLTKTRNYVTGVTGQYLITGTNASEFIKAGILGVVGDQTTTADGAVVAYLDGDGGLTTANAAYAVSMNNSTPNSGFNYGLDLQFISLNLGGVTTSTFKQADIRFNNGVTLVANTANNVSINANVTVGNIFATNLGNIASLNITGNASNVLYGNGVFSGISVTAFTANVNGGGFSLGNVGNIAVTGEITVTGNANIGNIGTALITATGNITGANLVTGGVLSVTGNATVGNIIATNIGNIANINLTGNASNVLYGNGVFSGISVTAFTANVNGGGFSLGNVGNIAVTGAITATGNATSGNILTGGIVSATGNANVGNLNVIGTVKTGVFITGNITAAATAGAGARAFVTDATVVTFGSAYVGGAANAVPVYSDGTGWFIG